jgi:hypothetical protein
MSSGEDSFVSLLNMIDTHSTLIFSTKQIIKKKKKKLKYFDKFGRRLTLYITSVCVTNCTETFARRRVLTRIDLKTNYEKEIPAFIKKKWN